MKPSDDHVKLYRAMIWTRDPDCPGQRVSVPAQSLEEAKAKLEAEYGDGNVFDLHNEEDASRPRNESGKLGDVHPIA